MESIDVQLKQAIQKAVMKAFDIELDWKNIVIEIPKNKNHGDFSSNVAMQLTRQLKQNPRMIAQKIIDHFEMEDVSEIEIAGPGFLNFILNKNSFTNVIREILEKKENYGTQPSNGIKVNLEYVSANPTGSLHLGHARGAAWGDSCARIMKKAGYDVTREYYVNDAGNQITNLALSLNARYRQAHGIDTEIGPDGYNGQDVKEKGLGVLLVSAELEEIMSLSDRIIVMHEGKITGRMKADEADEERLGLLMMGGHNAEEKGEHHE